MYQESIIEIKNTIHNVQTWPSKETLHKMEYKEKVNILKDVLLCSITQIKKLSDEAAAYLSRIDEEATMDVKFKEEKLAHEQERVEKKTQEYKELLKEFENLKTSKLNLEEKLKVESGNFANIKAKLEQEIDNKDKQMAESAANSDETKEESTKTISKVSIN